MPNGIEQRDTSSNPQENSHNQISIFVINNEQDLKQVLDAGLRELYKDVFAGAPYFEEYIDEEVDETFEKDFRTGLVLLAQEGDIMVGFSSARVIEQSSQLGIFLMEKGYSLNELWYINELGVSPEHRRKGIGRKLIHSLVNEVPPNQKSLLETHPDNLGAIGLYRSVGFDLIDGLRRPVEVNSSDGSVTNYETVVMIHNSKTP